MATAPHPTTTHPTKDLRCVVVTPERVFLDERVEFVALPIIDGELGILPGHMPIVGRLGYGELRVKTGTTTRRYFVDGGFAQVREDEVTVLTGRAIPTHQLDRPAAEKDFELALSRPVTTSAERELRDQALARARGMKRLAAHVGGAKPGDAHGLD